MAGLEDFARTNAHQPERRLAFPELAQEELKRSCLFCFVNLKHTFLGSERHNFSTCPACEEPRHIFLDTFPRFYNLFFPGFESEGQSMDQITSLAKIIHEGRFSRYLTNELARCVIGIHVCRRRVFRSLSANRPHSPLDDALRSRRSAALQF